MAIALPPPITPQQAPLEQMRAHAGQELLLDFRGVRIHLSGPAIDAHLVAPGRLQKALDSAQSPSEAVRSIGYLHYTAGYPATLVSYAVADTKDLYVRVTAGHVQEVRGPADIAAYFYNLKGSAALTAARLEADRVLADAQSQRAAEQFKPELRPLGDDAVALDLGEPSAAGRQTAAEARFSNYGNRYAGPYLAEASVRHSFASGDELSAGGAGSARFLGLGGSHSEPYHEGDLGWSRVGTAGLFSVQGRYADFQQALPGELIAGKLDIAGLSWLYPIHASFQSRLNLTGSIDRSDEIIDTQDSNQRLLSEHYFSVAAELSYVHRVEHDDHRSEIIVDLVLRHGLGHDTSAETTANQAYFLLKPSFGLRYGLTSRWTIAGDGAFQWSGNILPQQEQLVIGGPSSLHAYEAGVGVGDRGGNLRLSTEWQDHGDSWLARHELRPRLFAEYGTTTGAHSTPGPSSATVALADVGADLEMRLNYWLSGTVSLAQSVYEHGRQNSPDGAATKYVFFELVGRY